MTKTFLLTAIVFHAAALMAQVPVVSEKPKEDLTPRPAVAIDLSASMEPMYFSFSEISTKTNRADYGYFAQKTTINLKIQEDPWMLNLRLQNNSIFGNAALPDPLKLIDTRYPSPGSSFFLTQAYFRNIGLFLNDTYHIEAGIIPLHLGQGLLLSDNGMGFFGLHLAVDKILGPLDFEIALGNTNTAGIEQNNAFHMMNIGFKRTGNWTLGYLYDIDKSPRLLAKGQPNGNIRRGALSLLYARQTSNYFFNAEVAGLSGAYNPSDAGSINKFDIKANAYLLQGGWKALLPRLERLGPMDFSFLFVQGSGDKSATPNTDESYFAPLGQRFNGINRIGQGAFFGAGTSDGLSTTNTWNGLPSGLSGLTTFAVTFQTDAYSIISLPIRFALSRFVFRATQSSGRSKDLGGEWDMTAKTQIKERFGASLTFYNFTAGKAYEENSVKPESISGIKTLLSLAFE